MGDKDPPVDSVIFTIHFKGAYHENFTVVFMKGNNIYIHVELNSVTVLSCHICAHLGVTAERFPADTVQIEEEQARGDDGKNRHPDDYSVHINLLNQFIVIAVFIAHIGALSTNRHKINFQ